MPNAPEIIARRFLNRTGRHLFLTGKAGTGKTTFLHTIAGETHKKAVIAAPTGVAAINAGGVTLHSLFQLPFGTYVPSDSYIFRSAPDGEFNNPRTLMRHMHMHETKRRLLREMELLIIDEVSMLRADILDAVDRVLRYVRRRRDTPFGGVQVLFIGDLLQLPPVVKDAEWEVLKAFYNSIHFFEAHALRDNPPLYIELEKIYRQSDPVFIDILNRLRDNAITASDINLLNRCYRPDFSPQREEGYIHLTTHNRIADEINRGELDKLPGQPFRYNAIVEKDFREHQFPIDQELCLKEGAQVMFIRNDHTGERRFFNGKIGIILELGEDEIEVGFNDGSDPVLVERHTWLNKRFKVNSKDNEIREEIIGSYTQFPLKLAWAVTIHKSQGLTFDKAIIDVGRAFAPGQVYVALSRLVSLDGLVLTSKIPSTVFRKDTNVSAFEKTKLEEDHAGSLLEAETHRFVRDTLLEYYNFSDLADNVQRHLRSYDKDEKRSVKQRYKSRILKILTGVRREQEIAEKFSTEVRKITDIKDEGYLKLLLSRVKAAREYFEPVLKAISGSLAGITGELEDAIGVKQYLKELGELEASFFSKIQVLRKSVELVDSVIHKVDLQKREYTSEQEKQHRAALAQKTSRGKKKKSVKETATGKHDRPGKKKQMKKGDSAKISYDLLKSGKSIREIANTRELAIGTIETHLTVFIRKGEIDILELIDEEKVSEIRKALQNHYKDSIVPVKKGLGEGYSYGEIRMVMASSQ
ncbi:MAG: helix-turn-helix domain-containing protein [Bacteroidales bacterium]|nr:helix-turn-helix domain-containing protein [Bacteroidales bacterium]